jgi:hypothetical protein
MKSSSPTPPTGRFNVADPDAYVPAALLAPDGRYACDRCDFLCERQALTELPEGFVCPDCIAESVE